MTQKEINSAWHKRQTPNPIRATAYTLIKIREFEQRALALVRNLQK
jgi:hypothetical protein